MRIVVLVPPQRRREAGYRGSRAQGTGRTPGSEGRADGEARGRPVGDAEQHCDGMELSWM